MSKNQEKNSLLQRPSDGEESVRDLRNHSPHCSGRCMCLNPFTGQQEKHERNELSIQFKEKQKETKGRRKNEIHPIRRIRTEINETDAINRTKSCFFQRLAKYINI